MQVQVNPSRIATRTYRDLLSFARIEINIIRTRGGLNVPSPIRHREGIAPVVIGACLLVVIAVGVPRHDGYIGCWRAIFAHNGAINTAITFLQGDGAQVIACCSDLNGVNAWTTIVKIMRMNIYIVAALWHL